jgi:transcriptional antiterminator RfaH
MQYVLSKNKQFIVQPKGIDDKKLSSSANGWFCARTLPHKERFAEDNLVKNGFTVYCPRYQKWISSARQKQLVSRPLFPGYLFIQQAENAGFLGILRRSPGISTIVGAQNSFSVLPDTVILKIKQGENQSGFIEINHNRFKKGDKIKLNDERFSDMDAIFEEQDDLLRSIILIKLLGKANRVKVLTNSLEFV